MPEEMVMTAPAFADERKWLPVEYRNSTIALAVMAMVLLVDTLTGPLRYYLSHLGLSFLIYCPKICCLLFIVREMLRVRMNRVLFFVLLVLDAGAVVGVLHGVGLVSLVFSFLLMAPLLFGVCSARYFVERERAVVKLVLIIFLITALGIAIDIFIDYPWKGFVYKIDSQEIEGGRDWTTFGIERVAGFARTSVTAASYLASSALFLFGYCRSLRVRLLLLVITFPLLLVTTNKACIGGFIAGVAIFALMKLPRLQRLGVYCLALVVLLLPFSTLLDVYDVSMDDPVSLLLFASFDDRLINTWPTFLSAVSRYGSVLTGVGLGGIGSPARYFASGPRAVFSFADNFALYLYGIFGLFAVPIFLYWARVINNVFSSRHRGVLALAPVLVAMLAVALTTDVIEGQVFALFLGLALVLHRHDSDAALPSAPREPSP